MCDYCSCRLQPLIGELGAQHEALLAQAAGVEQALAGGDVSAARDRFEAMWADLEDHLGLEERALFPALASDDLFDGPLDVLRRDHAAARAAGPPGLDDAWVAFARRQLADLRDHIYREETDVFPAAVQVIDPARWDEAEAAR